LYRTAVIQLPCVLPGSHIRALEPGYSSYIICYKCSLMMLRFQTNKPDDDDDLRYALPLVGLLCQCVESNYSRRYSACLIT